MGIRCRKSLLGWSLLLKVKVKVYILISAQCTCSPLKEGHSSKDVSCQSTVKITLRGKLGVAQVVWAEMVIFPGQTSHLVQNKKRHETRKVKIYAK